MKIEILNDERGDWHQLIVDGKVIHEGHSIPEFVWIGLLRDRFGVEVEKRDHSFLSEEEYNM